MFFLCMRARALPVRIVLIGQVLFPVDVFTISVDYSEYLASFADWQQNNADSYFAGASINHMFSHVVSDSSTIGIAYLASVCDTW